MLWIGYGSPSHQLPTYVSPLTIQPPGRRGYWFYSAMGNHNAQHVIVACLLHTATRRHSWHHRKHSQSHPSSGMKKEARIWQRHRRASGHGCEKPQRRVRMRRIMDNFRSRRAPVTLNQQHANSQCAYRLHCHSYHLGQSVARTRLFSVTRYMQRVTNADAKEKRVVIIIVTIIRGLISPSHVVGF